MSMKEHLSVAARIDILRAQDFLVCSEVDDLMESIPDFNVEDLNAFLNYLKSIHCNCLKQLQEVEYYLEPLKGNEPVFKYCMICDLKKDGQCQHYLFEKEANVSRTFTTPDCIIAKLKTVVKNESENTKIFK